MRRVLIMRPMVRRAVWNSIAVRMEQRLKLTTGEIVFVVIPMKRLWFGGNPAGTPEDVARRRLLFVRFPIQTT